MNSRSLWDQWDQWYHRSHCLSPAISDNLGVMCWGDLWSPMFESYKLSKKFLKGSQPFLSGVPKWSWWRCSDAFKVQQNPTSQPQLSPTENNFLDFSHKTTFLLPRKTFQWVLLRILNKVRFWWGFFANTTPLKLRKKPITSFTARVSAQMSFCTTFTPLLSLQGQCCCLTSHLLSTPCNS